MLHLNSLLGRRTFKAVLGLCLFSTASVFAGVTATGDVLPNTDPATWTSTTSLRIGNTASGTLEITNGSQVEAGNMMNGIEVGSQSGSVGWVTVDGVGSTLVGHERRAIAVGRYGQGTVNVIHGGSVISDGTSSKDCIGCFEGSIGEVTVDGAGSSWSSIGHGLLIGDSGQGTLNIANGGTVSVEGETLLGPLGQINFNGGTLTAGFIWATENQLMGSGTIYTHGMISDTTLVFDSPDDLTQTVIYDRLPEQNITIHLEVGGQSPLGAGYTANGTMTIQNGMQLSCSFGYLGVEAGSTGAVTVDGVGSTWTCDGICTGYYGSGTLNITNGGHVIDYGGWKLYTNPVFSVLIGIGSEAGSTGVVNVDGAGSLWESEIPNLFVGRLGQGTLNITNGGELRSVYEFHDDGSSPRIYIGHNPDVVSSMLVDGAGSSCNQFYELHVGRVGHGKLTISGGGTVNNEWDGYIGYSSGSVGEVTVDGAGSTWNSGTLYVGYSGNGTLNITNGAAVINYKNIYNWVYSKGVVGFKSGSAGTVTVEGAGSEWTNSGDLSVGYEGSGTLHIAGGGAVNNAYGYVGNDFTSMGAVTVDGAGSEWTNSGDLSIGYEGSGSLNITHGGLVNNAYGYIGNLSGSTGEVTVDGAGSTWINSGDLSVGRYGEGTLNITNGGLVRVADGLSIGGDSSINLAGGGRLALMGKADDSLADFQTLIDGTDVIRYWDNSISDWAPLTEATYGKDYSLVYLSEGELAGYTVLTVGVIPGDYNGDRAVGLADYTVWADAYGQTGDDLLADGNGDGAVDLADYAIWADHFGDTVNVNSDTVVPSLVNNTVPAEGVYNTGEALTFTVTWDEALVVSGAPQLNLLIGEASQAAAYAGGSGTSALTFTYTIQPGDGGVLSVSQEIDLNGGAIADAAGNAAELFVNFASTEGVVVDTTVYPISGDYNGDWKVDLADYSLWADSFGQTGDDVPADGNDDGVVDIADYTIWANHFGQTAN